MEVLEIKGPTLIVAPGQSPLAIFAGPATTHIECHRFCEALTAQDGYQPPRANFGAGWNDTWWFGDQSIPPHPDRWQRLVNRYRFWRAQLVDGIHRRWPVTLQYLR